MGVVRGDEVDRASHHGEAGDPPVFVRSGQIAEFEAIDSGPQTDIRRSGSLGLHPDQVLDRCLAGDRRPLQQQLPGEERPVELPLAEDLAAHHTLMRGGGFRFSNRWRPSGC